MLRAIEEINTDIKKDVIIDQIMKSKGVYLLVSNPKVGKSMLALQLSNSVANGIPFLGYDVNPSPVLYISTESDSSQLLDRLKIMELCPNKDSLYIKDRESKMDIDLRDMEYDIKCFSEEHGGRLIIIDMLKDIDFGVEYDINSYQDVAQKVMPKLRYYCDKYNVTFLVTHHLNKKGNTLGSIALDAVVDGTIILKENKNTKKFVKFIMSNRDFESIDIQLKRNDNQTFSVCKSIEEDELTYELTLFIRYAAQQKEFDFLCSDIVNKANIVMSPKRFGRMMNDHTELLESEGVYITSNRTGEGRFYHCIFREPAQEDLKED